MEDLEPIFGQPNQVEWSAPNSTSTSSSTFLFHVHALDPSRLGFHVTDFHSNTFQSVRSVQQLEDLRDNIGIGGSWSEFLDYLITSIKSGNVKLVLEGQSKSGGAAHAKLVAQKLKGMPLISICLSKLLDATASEAMANLSLELYKGFKSFHRSLVNEQERCCELTKVISAEQDKNESIQRQQETVLYSKRQKSQKINEKATSDSLSVTSSQDSPNKQAGQTLGSTKVPNRSVPAYRRAKVRGVLLQDTENDADN